MLTKLIETYLKVFAVWMKLPEKLRYVLVGGWNTVVSYVLYALFLWLSDSRFPQVALFLSFLLSTVQSYLTQKIFVFATSGNYCREYVKCLGAWGVSYLFNVVLLAIFLRLGFNPYLAQVMAVVLVTVNSWLMLKHIAFKV